uniref:Consortin, connexin sorting protein b n=1 Tax=Hippocampus comes TaxID=109280 RepID=A0A3Q2XR60_HIPCM
MSNKSCSSAVSHRLETYGASSLSPELLASLQSLGENTDYTLLPHSLHQVGVYQLAIQLLQLEKLYHERVLFNLTVLQENWGTASSAFPLATLCERANVCLCSQRAAAKRRTLRSARLPKPTTSILTATIIFDNCPFSNCHEFVCCRANASGYVSLSPDGLVSILKRRRASLDGLPPPSNADNKMNAKRKVRFSEPEDGIDQDEVGGDSCLILVLLCLITVVISIGGTALYCSLVDTSSNICTDFTRNVDFFVTNVRSFFRGFGHWLPHGT